MLVRPVEDADIPAIAAIYAEAVRTGTATFELVPPEADEMRRRVRALEPSGHPVLVAVDADGAVAGYAYAGPYRPRPAYADTVETSVYVADGRRGSGVGRMLLEVLVERATERGFRQMVAVIGDSANAASIRLHAAAGFSPVGTLRSVGWKHGRWLDTVLMQRPLGPGDATPADRSQGA